MTWRDKWILGLPMPTHPSINRSWRRGPHVSDSKQTHKCSWRTLLPYFWSHGTKHESPLVLVEKVSIELFFSSVKRMWAQPTAEAAENCVHLPNSWIETWCWRMIRIVWTALYNKRWEPCCRVLRAVPSFILFFFLEFLYVFLFKCTDKHPFTFSLWWRTSGQGEEVKEPLFTSWMLCLLLDTKQRRLNKMQV